MFPELQPGFNSPAAGQEHGGDAGRVSRLHTHCLSDICCCFFFIKTDFQINKSNPFLHY